MHNSKFGGRNHPATDRHFFILFLIACLYSSQSYAQTDYSWWDQIHHWNGHTPRYKYVTVSPAYMGPNALPVPVVQTGRINSDLEIENSIDVYFSEGDKTQDWFARINVPLAKNKVSLSGYVVPLEHYSTDTATRDLRAGLTKSGEDWAGGDIYFATHIQLLKDRKHLPDAALELAMKTASGTHLRDARYTDAPGYFFDLSFGKTYGIKSALTDSMRWFAMGGFFTWQTYDDLNHQNDAPLYGAGFSVSKKNVCWKNELGGYSGYFNNGDQPLVVRSSLSVTAKRFLYVFMYQKGLNDFPYSGIRVSLVFHTGIFKKEK